MHDIYLINYSVWIIPTFFHQIPDIKLMDLPAESPIFLSTLVVKDLLSLNKTGAILENYMKCPLICLTYQNLPTWTQVTTMLIPLYEIRSGKNASTRKFHFAKYRTSREYADHVAGFQLWSLDGLHIRHTSSILVVFSLIKIQTVRFLEDQTSTSSLSSYSCSNSTRTTNHNPCNRILWFQVVKI